MHWDYNYAENGPDEMGRLALGIELELGLGLELALGLELGLGDLPWGGQVAVVAAAAVVVIATASVA